MFLKILAGIYTYSLIYDWFLLASLRNHCLSMKLYFGVKKQFEDIIHTDIALLVFWPSIVMLTWHFMNSAFKWDWSPFSLTCLIGLYFGKASFQDVQQDRLEVMHCSSKFWHGWQNHTGLHEKLRSLFYIQIIHDLFRNFNNYLFVMYCQKMNSTMPKWFRSESKTGNQKHLLKVDLKFSLNFFKAWTNYNFCMLIFKMSIPYKKKKFIVPRLLHDFDLRGN